MVVDNPGIVAGEEDNGEEIIDGLRCGTPPKYSKPRHQESLGSTTQVKDPS